MKIVVVGGNGTVGRHVVRRLRAEGYDAHVASRSTGVNIVTGERSEERRVGEEGRSRWSPYH